MNLKYIEPTGHDYPKQLDERIRASKDGTSACCTFNRRGTLLAIGCREGAINIWDFETRSIAKRLLSHSGIVTSVSWSRNGSKLLSSDWNGSLLLWDIITNKVLIQIQFENKPIEHSWLHGRSSKLCIIHLHDCQPLIITFKKNVNKNKNKNHRQIITVNNIKMINYSYQSYAIEIKCIQLSDFIPAKLPLPFKTKNKNKNKSESVKKSKKSIRKPPRITCGVFDKFAKHIYCGTSHGRLLIINYHEWSLISIDKITNSQQQIKSIVFSRCGNYIVLNCGDRIIRYVDIICASKSPNPSIEIKKQYQDAVERIHWNACCFSSNGEYICGASSSQSCVIYIWQRCYERSLEKVLKFDTSTIVDMIWHPIQPILVSVSQCGEIQIWNQKEMENGHNWSTFDANFKVLTKNIWAKEEINENVNENMHENENEFLAIDIFKEDGNFDGFSGDEFEYDLLNGANDSLKNGHELIHLPIQINSKYSNDEIVKYLTNIKQITNKYVYKNFKEEKEKEKEKELKEIIIKPSIKISNKNEKVLQNLTSTAHHHSHHHHSHHLNAKKLRKKSKNKHKNVNTNSQIHLHSINPFKSFNATNNNYNTLKMNASNVQKRSLSNVVSNNNNNNSSVINQPPKKKQKISHRQ